MGTPVRKLNKNEYKNFKKEMNNLINILNKTNVFYY